jgi:hypothetical protein
MDMAYEYLPTCSIGGLKLIKGCDIPAVLPQIRTTLSLQNSVQVRLTGVPSVPDRLAQGPQTIADAQRWICSRSMKSNAATATSAEITTTAATFSTIRAL